MSWIISNALLTDYVNSHFSRVLAEDCLEAIYLDGAQYALSSGTPTQLVYLSPDKMTAFSRLSRFGMMCKPLTEDIGEDLLMWYREDSHAKTLAAQEKDQELPESVQECGRTWRGSLAKYDPATHSLKTAQCSLFEDLIESSVILPRWGSMRSGELFQRQIPALRTCENESGLWRTPAAREPGVSADRLIPIEGGTPGGMNRHFDKHTGRMAQIGLSQQVRLREMWATPTTMDKLPPKSAEALHREATVARPGRSKPANLRDQVSNMQNWPTPRAFMHKDSTTDRGKGNLGEVVGGKLNPMWVEWLMGWPLGWTDLQPLGMDKFQEWQQQHSVCYPGE